MLTEDAQYTKSSKTKLYNDDDYWTPGEPALLRKHLHGGFMIPLDRDNNENIIINIDADFAEWFGLC